MEKQTLQELRIMEDMAEVNPRKVVHPQHPHKKLLPKQQSLKRVARNFELAHGEAAQQAAIVQTWAEVTNQTWSAAEREILKELDN